MADYAWSATYFPDRYWPKTITWFPGALEITTTSIGPDLRVALGIKPRVDRASQQIPDPGTVVRIVPRIDRVREA